MSSDRASMEIARFAPDEPLAERLVHLFVAMATELAATHERVDTLDRIFEQLLGEIAAAGDSGDDRR